MENPDVWKIALGAAAASGAAFVGFIASEAVKFVFFERYREWAQLRGDVASALVFHAGVYSNGPLVGPTAWDETTRDLRTLAARVDAFTCRRHFALTGAPTKKGLTAASSALIGLSNSSGQSSIEYAPAKVAKVRISLGIGKSDE